MFAKILVVVLVAQVVLGKQVDTKDEHQKPRFKRSSCAVTPRKLGDMTEFKYPASGNYQNYARCYWQVCPGTTRAQVTITKMDIELQASCGYDAVIIDNIKYCGTSLRTLDVSTDGGCIAVGFTSDGSVQMSGFDLEIRPIRDNYSSDSYPSYSSDSYPSYSSHYYPSYSSDPYPSYSSHSYPSYSSHYYPSYSSHYYPSYSSDPYPSYSSNYYPSYSSHYYPSYSSDYYPSYSSSYYPDSSQGVYNGNSSSVFGMVGVLHHAQDTLQDAQETVDAIEEQLQLK